MGYFCEWSCYFNGSLFRRIIILTNKQFIMKKFKDYLKRTRHHLHAIVGIIGGFLASLALSWVWLGFRNLDALDKAMWFLAPA